jgi:hypothetical protein
MKKRGKTDLSSDAVSSFYHPYSLLRGGVGMQYTQNIVDKWEDRSEHA